MNRTLNAKHKQHPLTSNVADGDRRHRRQHCQDLLQRRPWRQRQALCRHPHPQRNNNTAAAGTLIPRTRARLLPPVDLRRSRRWQMLSRLLPGGCCRVRQGRERSVSDKSSFSLLVPGDKLLNPTDDWHGHSVSTNVGDGENNGMRRSVLHNDWESRRLNRFHGSNKHRWTHGN